MEEGTRSPRCLGQREEELGTQSLGILRAEQAEARDPASRMKKAPPRTPVS